MANVYIPAAGQLRERITFQRKVATPDGMGGSSSAWTDLFAGVPAQIVPLAGIDQLIAQGLQAVFTFQIWVRYDSMTSTIIAGDRIYNPLDKMIYDIVTSPSNPDQRRRMILIVGRTGADQ